MSKISLYSDGGCRMKDNVAGNTVGPTDKSAYAFKIEENGETLQLFGEAMYGKTNNNMELTGFREAIKWLVDNKLTASDITAYLDSQYVLASIDNGWLKNWKENDWTKSDGKPVANLKEWKEIDELLSKFSNITYVKVKSHSGDSLGNVEVDALLNKMMDELQ